MEDADILVHFEACNQFIGAQLSKGRGVLVHCLAGISEYSSLELRKTRISGRRFLFWLCRQKFDYRRSVFDALEEAKSY